MGVQGVYREGLRVFGVNNPILRLDSMAHVREPSVAFYTPEQAAAAVGLTLDQLTRAHIPRVQLSPRIVRYLSTDLDRYNDGLRPRDCPEGGHLTNDPPAAVRKRRPERRRPCLWVYIIRARPSGNLKIGQAVNVEERLNGLQTGTWETLEIVHTIRDDRNLERELHRLFAGDRIGGEWFRPSGAIKTWLELNHGIRL